MEGSSSNPNNSEFPVVLSPDPISFIPAPGSFCRLLLPKSMRDDLDRQFGYRTNAHGQQPNVVVPKTRGNVAVRVPFVPAMNKDKKKIRDINLNIAWTEGDDDVSKGKANDQEEEELDLELRL